jgi:hypothetical protein
MIASSHQKRAIPAPKGSCFRLSIGGTLGAPDSLAEEWGRPWTASAARRQHTNECGPTIASLEVLGVAKYDKLFEWLCQQPDQAVELAFTDIDHLVGGLPASARRHRAWWANEIDGAHVQASAWLNAGREVDSVDVNAARVRFTRAHWRRGA